MNQIIINKKTYTGKTININNGKINIDGKQINTEEQLNITIEVIGDINKLEVDSCSFVKISGNVESASTVNGDLKIDGDVNGNVSSVNGDIKAKEIKGSVSTVNGDITKN